MAKARATFLQYKDGEGERERYSMSVLVVEEQIII